MPRTLALIGVLLLATLAGAVACSSKPKPTERERVINQAIDKAGDIDDPAALMGALAGLASRRYTETLGLASRIAAKTDDPAMRERSLRMKIRAGTFVDNLVLIEDPRRAFVYCWLFTEERLYHVTQGEGRGALGPFQEETITSLRETRATLIAIGYEHFGQEIIDEAADDMALLAQRQVLQTAQIFADRMPFGPTLQETARNNGDLRALLDIPFSPVGAMQGVSGTPVAIKAMSQMAGEIGRVIQNLPERVRWQTELLLYEAESLETVQSLRADADRLSGSADRLSRTAEALPGQMRQALADAEEAQPELRKTAAEVRATAETMDRLAQSTNQAAQSINVLLEQWQALSEKTRDNAKPRDPDAPAAVEQWTELTKKIAEASSELRGLVSELERPLAEAQQISADSIDRATDNTHDLINAAAWRAAGVVVLAFVLAVVYRLMFRKRDPR